MNTKLTDEEIREAARKTWAEGSDDELEIDDNAEVHHGNVEGHWVAAWVYVRDPK